MRKYILGTALVLTAAIVALQSGSAQQPAGPFTAQQSAAGRTAYAANCATCHAADLSGGANAPALAGGLFMGSWGDKTPADLIEFIQASMPPGNPGTLGAQAYVSVAAFLLESNGSRAGAQPLTATTRIAIRTVATGQIVPQSPPPSRLPDPEVLHPQPPADSPFPGK